MEWQGMDNEKKEEKMRPKTRELHEQLYTEIVSPGLLLQTHIMPSSIIYSHQKKE